MPPIIDVKKCKACGYCAEICPLDVLYLDKQIRKLIVRYPEECWHCKACVKDCPVNAISIRYPLSHMMLHFPKEGLK